MRLATVLTPLSDENLSLAAQCGVTDVVTRYPGPELSDLQQVQRRIAAFGLELSVIEGYLPLEKIKLGEDREGLELQALRRLIEQQGDAGVPILCYNFMAGTDWVRTRLDAPERGGARVTAFDRRDAERALLLSHDGVGQPAAAPNAPNAPNAPDTLNAPNNAAACTAEALWERLERLLDALLPVAERAGVTLAMHPDDPPLAAFQGRSRIMNSVESFERLMAIAPSPRNGICFCQGSFAEMGVDLIDAVRRLGPHICYVHCRDVRGTADSFVETFHDNGPTDMLAVMRAYREAGFNGPLRPDHVPQLAGEEHGEPGYTMRGRLFAYGYLRGLMQAAGAD